ncbi:MAG: PepSY domain-containing protein [Flavobacterium sp.]|nr:PepSY domain-containing protein [Flavobacterium sp.]
MGNKKPKGYTFRKFIRDIHLWLGVGSGIILFLVCLSGTIYTFRHEVEQLMEPEKYEVDVTAQSKITASELIASTQQSTGGKVTRISLYDDPHKPAELQVSKSKEDKRGETYYVNPYSNAIIGTGKGPSSDFFMFFFKMHRWLLLDQEIGRPIVGVSTLIFIVLTITGLILWLPKKVKGWKSFKPGLRIKFSANWKRVNHDLHNVLGFYTFILILIMALSGLNWSFEWYKDGMSNVLGAKVFGSRGDKTESVIKPGAQSLTVDQIVSITNNALPYNGKITISLAKGSDGAFEVRKNNSDNFNKEATDKVVIDQYSGTILKKELFSEKTTGEKIAMQMKAIHLGDIYGMFSKIIYFISCLIATSLPITGVIIWINKLRKPNKKIAAQV